MSLVAGTQIDGYEVLGLLGAGGMGEVYRARDPILKRDVAIKVLPAFVAADPVRLARFKQEAQAAGALNHPNILVIYRLGSYEGAPYLACELLEGGTLREYLQRGPMTVRKTIEYGVQIAHGLAAAHDKGIVHRDLKPENIFVTRDGRIKILDFGLAKLVQRDPLNDETTMALHTDPGTVMGTAGYMSPEQVRGLAVDHRADLFAFGAILYEMLTGKRAFQRSTSAETMTAILKEDPPSISLIVPVAPPALQRVVQRCLEKNAEQRFQSASDLGFALEALSETSGVVPVASGSAVVMRTPRHLARLAIGAFAFCVIAAVGYFAVSKATRPSALRITGYTQLTHSGKAGEVVGTDGSRIYLFSSIWEPIQQLAVSGGEIEDLTKVPPKSFFNDISPDGSTLLYMSYAAGNTPTAPLYTLKLVGGAPQYIATVRSASFAPGGQGILYEMPGGEVFLMNVDGSNKREVASLGERIALMGISNDGAKLRYEKGGAFWEVSLGGKDIPQHKDAHEFLSGWRPSVRKCCGGWSPDESIFLFMTPPGWQIWAIDERKSLFHHASTEPVQLTSSPIRWGYPAFSKDGKQILCTGSTERGELIRFDPKNKQFLPFLKGVSADLVSFSRDGKTVAYAHYPDNTLWKSNVDGTDRIQLSDAPFVPSSVSLSPDGSQVAFMSPVKPGLYRSYVVSARGGQPQLLIPNRSGPETDPEWSPDGHKIAFGTDLVGSNESTSSGIRFLDVDTHQITEVPGSEGKYSPRWSPDGQYLLAAAQDNATWYIYDVKMQRWRVFYKGVTAYAYWSHDGRYIYALRFAGEKAVLRIPVSGGEAEVMADLKNIQYTGIFGIWMGLDPADSPLLLRDLSTRDVYALSLER